MTIRMHIYISYAVSKLTIEIIDPTVCAYYEYYFQRISPVIVNYDDGHV